MQVELGEGQMIVQTEDGPKQSKVKVIRLRSADGLTVEAALPIENWDALIEQDRLASSGLELPPAPGIIVPGQGGPGQVNGSGQ